MEPLDYLPARLRVATENLNSVQERKKHSRKFRLRQRGFGHLNCMSSFSISWLYYFGPPLAGSEMVSCNGMIIMPTLKPGDRENAAWNGTRRARISIADFRDSPENMAAEKRAGL